MITFSFTFHLLKTFTFSSTINMFKSVNYTHYTWIYITHIITIHIINTLLAPKIIKTMNHNQTNSLLSTIPFSWEMIPGVPKHMVSPASASPPLPPPPSRCLREPVMRRSVSAMFWREEDPFLLALKECSKDNKVKGEKKRFGILGSKSFLWCKCSFDVEEGNLMRKRPVARSGGPVTPPERVHGLIRIHKGLRNWTT